MEDKIGLSKKGISGKGIIAAAVVLFSAAIMLAAFIGESGLPFSLGGGGKEPSWVQCKLLLNSDFSYEFFIAFSDDHDEPMTDVEGTGRLRITYGSQILYDSDFTVSSTDYTRKMPGDSKERVCAFIQIPPHAVKAVEGEVTAMGRARVDFETSTGGVFQDIEFDVEVSSTAEE